MPKSFNEWAIAAYQKIVAGGSLTSPTVVAGADGATGATTTNPVPTIAEGQYNTTLPTPAATDYVPAQTDPNGNLRNRLVLTTVSGADGLANTNVGRALASTNQTTELAVQIVNMVYNGTTWDRQRGDTNGTLTQPGLSATHWSYAAKSGGISNTTTAVTIKASAGGALKNCITAIQITAGTLGADTEVAIRDGAAGPVLWRGFLGTAGGQLDIVFPVPIVGSAATLLEVVTLTATVTGGVYVNVQGFTR